MTYSYAHPVERFSLSLARRWLLAYPLAQLLCLGAATAAAAMAGYLPDFEPSQITLATGIAVAAIYGLTFGYLRGCLLREKIARLPMLTWCVAIAAISLYFLPPIPQALPGIRGPILNLPASVLASMPAVLSGFVYGIVIGAAEAFALRRAASGLFGWIIWSGFAWGLGYIGASAVMGYGAPLQLTSIQTNAMQAACLMLQACIAGLVTLPALGLLAPRLNYYGPRVYRTTLRTPLKTDPA